MVIPRSGSVIAGGRVQEDRHTVGILGTAGKRAARMEITQFEEMQAEFLARVSQAVYCILTTFDRQNRPRSRVMHPIWDGPIGWVISWPQSHKAKHLAHNPAVSLAYIPDKDKPVYVDTISPIWWTKSFKRYIVSEKRRRAFGGN